MEESICVYFRFLGGTDALRKEKELYAYARGSGAIVPQSNPLRLVIVSVCFRQPGLSASAAHPLPASAVRPW